MILLVLVPAVCMAQETEPDNLSLSANGIKEESFDVSNDLINQLKKDYTSQANISEEDLGRFDSSYNQIIKDLEQIKELEAQKIIYLQMQKNAPTDKELLEKQLSEVKGFTSPEVSIQDISLPEAESKLAQAQVEFNNAKQVSSRFENEPQRRAKRTTEIPEAISKATENLTTLTDIKPPTDKTAKNGLAYIEFLKKQTRLQLHKVQIETFQEELKAYEAAKNILPLRRELAAKVLANTEKQVEFWQNIVNQIRKKNLQQVKQEAQSAAQQVKYSNEAAKQIAQDIISLTDTQAGLLKKIEDVTKYHKQVSSSLAEIQDDFNKTKELLGKSEKVTSTMGMLLRIKKENLPEIKQNAKNIKSRFDVISSAQLEWHKSDSQWTELLNLESKAEELLGKVNILPDNPDYARQLNELKQYLEQKRNILSTISSYYIDYLNMLALLDADERDLIDIVQNYSMLIEKNVLWIKSRSSFDRHQISNTAEALKSLLDVRYYSDLAKSYIADFKTDSVLYSLVLILVILLSGLRFWFKSKILYYTGKIKQAETDRFIYTCNTAVLSVIAALPLTIVFAFIVWRYTYAVTITGSSSDLYNGLRNITVITFLFFLLRWVTMPDGLCTHLKFDKKALASFRNNLLWFYVCIIISTFLYSMLDNLDLHLDIKNAGLRAIFIIEQIFVTIFLYIVFNPKGSILSSMQNLNSSPRIYRLTRFAFILVVAIPFVFCLVSIIGYINAARHLQFYLAKSILFFLAVVFVYRMILRSLFVSRRKLVLAKYKQQKQDKQNNPDAGEMKFEEIHDSILNLSKQSRQIIDVLTTFVVLLGLWWIWKSTLPALEALEQIELGSTTDSQGQIYVIRLGSTFKALIIFVLTIFTSKNIPGLLEIFILQKLEIPSGTRFAFTTIVKYIISITGLVYACSALGVRWETVQWLIAAVSVGLGFGLQEIFANFISGLIILFEQPVRVGDYVTIDDVSGQVTQIKIRATTIVKWDRKELLVPNKEFITGRLINWTLSDDMLRLDFPVGVAYGSDIKKVEETLFKVAGMCDKVTHTDPKPKVIFKGFGDSCLDFELRAYITDVEDYLQVWHKINCDIDTEFRNNHIEIAFPQRDLHLRSSDITFPISVDANKPKDEVIAENNPDIDK